MTFETKPIKILLIEDNDYDRVSFRRAFSRNQIHCEIAECSRAEEALSMIRNQVSDFDIVVVDQGLPGMSGLDMCRNVIEEGLQVPLVLLTGSGSEQLAVQALKSGVDDYIIKDPGRAYLELLPVVLPKVAKKYTDRLARQKAEADRERLILELQAALNNVKTLSGLMPICASCKKIRDDKGYWQKVEDFIREHTQAEFSHSICPECAEKLYPAKTKREDTDE